MSKKSMARSNALLKGDVHFVDHCPIHGADQVHFTSSGRCRQCTAAAKQPSKQAAYWAENAPWINAKRRSKAHEDRM